VGFVFVANVLLFAMVGSRLDGLLSTGGVLTATFIVLGVGSSFVLSYLALRRAAEGGRGE
jgi:hypothetical protein